MRKITFRIGWQSVSGGTYYFNITVKAKSINAGFKKAVADAFALMKDKKDTELTRIEFWEYT